MGFTEPLEATSIHSTIVQLTYFVFEYLRDTLEDTYSHTLKEHLHKD